MVVIDGKVGDDALLSVPLSYCRAMGHFQPGAFSACCYKWPAASASETVWFGFQMCNHVMLMDDVDFI